VGAAQEEEDIRTVGYCTLGLGGGRVLEPCSRFTYLFPSYAAVLFLVKMWDVLLKDMSAAISKQPGIVRRTVRRDRRRRV